MCQFLASLNESRESFESYFTPKDMFDIWKQQKIADFLSTFDAKITAVQKKIEAWETIKKGLMQRLFV